MVGMRLYRRSKAPARVRRRASLWTSYGAVALLSVSITVLTVFRHFSDGAIEGGRRLTDDESAYPDDPFIDQPYKDAGNKYWIFIHIIIIAYMLLGLNTVCDLYFTGALDEMVNKWDIKPDVAGATFMAAGGSAPELFTSLIGAIISESDVGFGTIVGSAVFNVLFVIGLCGFSASVPIKLTWWPLARDCTYYVFGLSMLAIFAKSGKDISLAEAIMLFIGYLGYCTLMYFNPQLEKKFVSSKKDPVIELKPVVPVIPVHPPEPIAADTGSTVEEHHPDPPDEPGSLLSTGMGGSHGTSERSIQDPTRERSDHERHHHIKKSQPHFERKSMVAGRHVSKEGVLSFIDTMDNEKAPDNAGPSVPEPEDRSPPILPIPEEEEEEDDIDALLERPEGSIPQVCWFTCLPIYGMLYYGIPKPTERCFLATFGVSLLWIAGFSFFLVYCVEILGAVCRIPVIIMGFTLLAAGTSIPDLVSSMAVARAGEGDMAVSSSIGSNIFDILVGLPIPWIIKILFVEICAKGNKSYKVPIISDYIVMYVIILVVMVGCVVCSIHALGWYLNRTLGMGMAVLYAIFLVIVLSVEFSEPEALKF